MAQDGFELAGRVAIVTGGTTGIGAAVVERLREVGATPVVWDIVAGADVVCDVSDPAAVTRAVHETQERFAPPTALVACAGVLGNGSILDLDVGVWEKSFAVNARGVFLCLQAVAREIVRTGDEGSIVVIGSVNGAVADPSTSPYSSSKAAAMHLARVAARELGEHGIRVNAIGPGPTDTPMMADTKSIAGYREEIANQTPLGRIGVPRDIALAAVGVMQMGWVTGQVFMADGGSSLATARGATIGARARQIHSA
jgi:NAD(P)-dependent dehydrogenase (short-subunit alcohol dehydrogenase family)